MCLVAMGLPEGEGGRTGQCKQGSAFAAMGCPKAAERRGQCKTSECLPLRRWGQPQDKTGQDNTRQDNTTQDNTRQGRERKEALRRL
jgi:hypothetical protein